MRHVLTVVIGVFLVSGCVSRYDVAVTYAPPTGQAVIASDPRPVVAVTAVTDQRTNDPNVFGVIRGGYGNPLKILQTDRPVKDMVASAFTDALAARGWLAKGGSEAIDLTVVMHRFDSNQYERREAHTDFVVTLTDAKTGQSLYTDRVTTSNVNGSRIALNVSIFASVEDLRKLAVDTLNETINAALDKPGFRDVVMSAGAK